MSTALQETAPAVSATGIDGLDDILCGGFATNRMKEWAARS
jgi:hypothetical protein